MARFTPLPANKFIKDTYTKINNGFDNFETDVNAHFDGSADKHNAADIVYGATNVDAELASLDGQIQAISVADSNATIGVYSVNGVGTDTITGAVTDLTYFGGLKINLTIQNDNTGTTTFNLNDLGAKTIYKIVQGVKTELSPRDLRVGEIAILEYDGTDFILLNGEREADYSEPVSTYEKVIHLDDTVVKGQVSVGLKGQTVTPYISPKPDKWYRERVNADGSFSERTDRIRTDYIKVEPSTSYQIMFSKEDIYEGLYIRPYNENKEAGHAIGSTFNESGYELTTPSDCEFLVFVARRWEEEEEILTEDILEMKPYISEVDGELYQTHWLSNGTKSTVSTRLKSVGRNLFNKETALPDSGIDASGNVISINRSASDFIRVRPLTTYTASSGNHHGSSYTAYYDNSKQLVGTDSHNASDPITFTTPNNCFYVRLTIRGSIDVYSLVEGDELLNPYEPFKLGSEAYLPPIGGSLPNGTKDEVSESGGVWEKVQRTGKDTDISDTDYDTATDLTEVTVITTTAFADALLGTADIDGQTRYYNKDGVELQEIAEASADDADLIDKAYYFDADKKLNIIVAFETAIGDARTSLGTTSLIYQLAEPMITPLQGIGQLIAYPNGTVYVTPTTKQETTHKEGMLLEFPVSWLESVTLLNINGTETQIDLDDATIHRQGDDATAEAGTNTTNITVTGHGLSVGDRIRNTDRDNEIREILTVVDANNVTVNEITGQTDGDTIEIYSDSEEDKTQNAIVSIEDADEGSLYQVIYDTPSEIRTNPESSYSYPQNVSAVIQGNTQMIKVTNKELTDFMSYQNAVNIAFDLRITAVE